MRNPFIVDGEVAKIFMTMKDGTEVVALVDAEDIPKVAPYRWHAAKQRDGYRIVCHMRPTGKGAKVAIYMHRVVMGHPEGKFVDHISCDPSDNRKANLRLSDYKTNGQNRKKLNSKNTTGVHGVTYHSTRGYYQVSLTINGKTIYAGQYRDFEKAKVASIAFRQKHMPYSQEAMALTA